MKLLMYFQAILNKKKILQGVLSDGKMAKSLNFITSMSSVA
jgi:hypothetical protein